MPSELAAQGRPWPRPGWSGTEVDSTGALAPQGGILQDGTWHHFKMDLGDPDHREAFLNGEMPSDLSAIRQSEPQG